MPLPPDPEKARRYITSLDNVRCHDRWDEVPELIRKVTKHAPHKTCYIETATAEYKIVSHIRQSPPSTQSSSASASSNLPGLIPSLLSTIEKADGTPQEVFQAQVCLGWLHWTLNEPKLAVARLPKDISSKVRLLSSDSQALSPWTEVCLVKGCYIKGTGQLMLSGSSDALDVFCTLLPWLHGIKQSLTSTPQFSHWSERFLAKGALLANETGNVEVALKILRFWSDHPDVKQMSSSHPSHYNGAGGLVPKSQTAVWKTYYDILSRILRGDLKYYPQGNGPERCQLATEIRRVESIYETRLLQEVKFPTAKGTNEQIEAWVEQVIQNWEVLCGTHWCDEDIREGGQSGFARNVLEILYRAAAKTYHSFLILRRLFHVHSSLAEFDLALKALDSYIELVTGAKDRAEKSAGAESGTLEDDRTFIQTLSEGVFLLSRFGSFAEAVKAKALTVILHKYIDKVKEKDANGDTKESVEVYKTPTGMTLAMGHRAIGIGLANWAHWSPVNETRDDIRAKAIDFLRTSIAPEFQDELNPSSLYTLGILLAESRDLAGAIDYVKLALAGNPQDNLSLCHDVARARDLVPLWHLLALLLSAQHKFDIAQRSCEAAFEHLPSVVGALDHEEHETRPLQHITEKPDQEELKHTLIHKLMGREKEWIIETRVTQLAIVELMDGPEAALNHSSQLLKLFMTLFSNLDLSIGESTPTKTEHLVPPKSSAGTVRSFRGSIFGRHKGARTSERMPEASGDTARGSSVSTEPKKVNESTLDAPAIQITDEDRTGPRDRSQTVSRSDSARKLQKRSGSLKRKEHPSTESSGINGHGINGDRQTANHSSTASPKLQESSDNDVGPETVRARDQPKGANPHNPEHTKMPPPIGHEKHTPEQDVRLPTSYRFDSPTAAVTRFPVAQAQKHALGILVKLWLLIAGLYRRASLFEDANEACEEAAKQAARVEALVASQDSSARALATRGWGAGKSSEEIWADVYAERGLLSQAQSRPHEAIEHFEEALLHFADHPRATVGLANLLLDIWDQKIPAEPSQAGVEVDVSSLCLSSEFNNSKSKSAAAVRMSTSSSGTSSDATLSASANVASRDIQPKLLNRLAARDRAYGLLSALTKLGTSWDDSEAWYTLSRAYEAGEQTEKLKDVLWWCIELEDSRPIRHWSNIGSNLYVL